MTVVLTLPAYNEEQGLPALLETFRTSMTAAGIPHRVVIVDDGSHDGTCAEIEEAQKRLPITLIRHERNLGLGDTIRDALRAAADSAAADDVIVTMDADNTHDPALIPQMLPLLAQGKDVVIASRYRDGSKVVGLRMERHLMSLGARALFQIAFPIRGVRDYTCGFRAYRAPLLKLAFATYGDAFVTERSFACMAEILLRLAKLKIHVAEVPMVLRYDRKGGASKMKVAKTVIKTLHMMLRLRFAG